MRSSPRLTYCVWNGSEQQLQPHNINIIDTPERRLSPLEVERASASSTARSWCSTRCKGVQSQSFTVDRQMKRDTGVPRIAFVNKMLGQPRRQLRARGRDAQGEARAPPGQAPGPDGRRVRVQGDHRSDRGEGILLRRRRRRDGEAGGDPGRVRREGRRSSPRNHPPGGRRRRRARREVPQRGAHLHRGSPGGHPARDARAEDDAGHVRLGHQEQGRSAPARRGRLLPAQPDRGRQRGPRPEQAGREDRHRLRSGEAVRRAGLQAAAGQVRPANVLPRLPGKGQRGRHDLQQQQRDAQGAGALACSGCTPFDDREEVESAESGDIVAFYGVEASSGETFTDGKVNVTLTSIARARRGDLAWPSRPRTARPRPTSPRR